MLRIWGGTKAIQNSADFASKLLGSAPYAGAWAFWSVQMTTRSAVAGDEGSRVKFEPLKIAIQAILGENWLMLIGESIGSYPTIYYLVF